MLMRVLYALVRLALPSITSLASLGSPASSALKLMHERRIYKTDGAHDREADARVVRAKRKHPKTVTKVASANWGRGVRGQSGVR
jgi:phage terminase small subunit